MKKIIAISALLSAVAFSAQNIKFEENPKYSELLAKAKKENKLLFIDAFASWCGPCKLMAKNIFTKPAVADYYNKNFVNAGFDMEKGEGVEIARKFGVRSYPTWLFINGDGELISQNMGYMDDKMFIELAQEANAPNNKKGTMKDRFEKGESDPEFLINAMKLHANSDFDFAKKVSERYFSTKKSSTITKDEVGFLLYFTKKSTDPNFKYLVDHQKDITAFLPEKTLNDFISQIRLGDLAKTSIDENSRSVKDAEFLQNAIPLVGKEEAENALNRLKLDYYSKNSQPEKFAEAAVAYFKDGTGFAPQELLATAWFFAENVKSPANLKSALTWAEKSVMAGETSENTYILAKLYALSGKKSEAKSYAEYSRSLAEKDGKTAELATKLLSDLGKN